MSAELHRHVHALVADLAAEYGEVDLVGRRVECTPDAHDALVEAFESFGVVGGAGARVRADGQVLLVRYHGADGWLDPGDGRRPGETYRECATRAVREVAGGAPVLEDLAQVHLLYMDDWTGRRPVPNPHVVFDGCLDDDGVPSGTNDAALSGEDAQRPRDGIAEIRWVDEPPEDLLYDELAELPLLGG